VRPAGEDVRAGDVVVQPGGSIGAAEVGLLATLGYSQVRVFADRGRDPLDRQRAGRPGTEPGPGQIPNTNTYSLMAQVIEAGAEPINLGVAPDQLDAITERISLGLRRGRRPGDLRGRVGRRARPGARRARALRRRAPPLEGVDATGQAHHVRHARWAARVRPARNPVSAMVTFELFVRPALRRMAGAQSLHRPRISARALATIENPGSRRGYLRVTLTPDAKGFGARLTGDQGSAILRSMVLADGLAVVAPDTTIAEGQAVDVIVLRSLERVPLSVDIVFNRVLRSARMTRALGALAAVAILAGGCASRAPGPARLEVGKLRSELAELRVAQEVTGRDLARVGPQIERSTFEPARLRQPFGTMSGEASALLQAPPMRSTTRWARRGRAWSADSGAPPPAALGPPPTSSAIAAVERRASRRPSPAVPPSQVAHPRRWSAGGAGRARAADPPVQPQVAPPAPAASRAAIRSRSTTRRWRRFDRVSTDRPCWTSSIHREVSQARAGGKRPVLDRRGVLGAATIVRRWSSSRRCRNTARERPPDALVKIGLCHARLRNASRAEQAWQRVIREYPKSEAAVLAQSLLRTNAASRQ